MNDYISLFGLNVLLILLIAFVIKLLLTPNEDATQNQSPNSQTPSPKASQPISTRMIICLAFLVLIMLTNHLYPQLSQIIIFKLSNLF